MFTSLCCVICSKTLIEIAMAIVTLLTFCKGICEYEEHLRRNRTKLILDFSERYMKDKRIQQVVKFLEELEDDNMYKKDDMDKNNTYNEKAISIHDIEMFMHFIEEIQLLIKSNSISESAALNLFGHYTTILDKYHTRWPRLCYNEKFWTEFREFANKAKKFDYKNITL